jgi:hypothetical protein
MIIQRIVQLSLVALWILGFILSSLGLVSWLRLLATLSTVAATDYARKHDIASGIVIAKVYLIIGVWTIIFSSVALAISVFMKSTDRAKKYD